MQIVPSSMNCLCLRLPRISTPYQCRPFSSLRIIQTPALRSTSSFFHFTGDLRSRKQRGRNDYFSSSTPHFQLQDAKPEKLAAKTDEPAQNNKRKTTRPQAAKNSLRRVAVEAQQSRDGKGSKKTAAVAQQENFKVGHSSGALVD